MSEIMLGQEAFSLLKKYNIPVVKTISISTIAHVKKLKPPFVLKVISPKHIHKTKTGAIKFIYNKEDAVRSFRKLKNMGDVIAQPLIKGPEFIIGVKRDRTFGHVIMFGLGGIYVEVFGDVSFRAVPITRKDAYHMITSTRAYKLLSLHKKPNIEPLISVLMAVNKMVMQHPDINELDINPFIFDGKKGKVVDVRIIKNKE